MGRMHYSSVSYKIFTISNYLFLSLLALVCLVPLIHILAVSLSSKAAADANMVSFWPVKPTFMAYTETAMNNAFFRAFGIGLLRTIIGPAVSLVVCVMAAYSLEKESREFKSRSIYVWFFVFTMIFNGGLVPTYMVISYLQLRNSFLVLILPAVVGVYNIILLINFFRTSVPSALKDAAYVDGASHFRTMFSIYLPLSVPAIVTISLFNIVYHWNSYFDGLIYMTNIKNYPLATFLQTFIVAENFTAAGVDKSMIKLFSNRTVRAAEIFLAITPVLAVYPFLQRYFIKGIVLGSIKE